MNKVFKWLLTASLVFMLTGCFGSSWHVKVGKDGSGTLSLRMYVSRSFSEMMVGMGGGEPAVMTGESFMAKNDPAVMAAQIGDGVTVVSAESFETETEVGFETVYKFDNINNLKLNPMTADPNTKKNTDPGNLIQFYMENDKLRIVMLGNAGGETMEMEEDPEAAQAQAMMSMMKDLFRDMKFNVTVEATDKIKKTNATYREGNIITLMDMEMAKIMGDEFLFNEMVESKGATSKEVQKQFEKAGVYMEDQVEVTVQF